MRYQHALSLVASLAALSAISLPAQAEDSMAEYAAKCDAQIGVSVPEFLCDSGTLIPGQGDREIMNTGICDNPQMFSSGSKCNPGSMLKNLYEDDDVFIVAICRKDGQNRITSTRYDDVAIIQHNKDNGATCFYQRRRSSANLIEDPADAGGEAYWYPPGDSAYNSCPKCHDNGPLLRSTFLTKVTGKDALPATGDPRFNGKDRPYWLVGDYHTDELYRPVSVDAEDNRCTSCHRLGAMTSNSGGDWHINFSSEGSLHHAKISVRSLYDLQNPTDGSFDILRSVDPDSEKTWWMPPERNRYEDHAMGLDPDQWEAEYLELAACKEELKALNQDRPVTEPLLLPDSSTCRVSFLPEIRDQPGLRRPSVEGLYRIRGRYEQQSFLVMEDSTPSVSEAGADSAAGKWRFERAADDRWLIRNAESRNYLCAQGATQLGECADAGDSGAEWRLEHETATQRVYRIRNAVTGATLYQDEGQIALGEQSASSNGGWWTTDPAGSTPGSCTGSACGEPVTPPETSGGCSKAPNLGVDDGSGSPITPALGFGLGWLLWRTKRRRRNTQADERVDAS